MHCKEGSRAWMELMSLSPSFPKVWVCDKAGDRSEPCCGAESDAMPGLALVPNPPAKHPSPSAAPGPHLREHVSRAGCNLLRAVLL